MSVLFDRGNVFLNDFVSELVSVKADDRIIEIGFGTGKLIYKMAQRIDSGLIEGIDFSKTMVSIAQKRNRKNIAKGRVKIREGNIDEVRYEKERYSKVCSVNTIYFWPAPVSTAKKIAKILKPDGRLILGFEDIEQLKQRNLDRDVFHIYSKDEVKNIFSDASFSNNISIVTRKKGKLVFHCVVAVK